MAASDALGPQFVKGDIVEVTYGSKRKRKRIVLDSDAHVKDSGYVKIRGNRARLKDNVVTQQFDAAYAHHSNLRKVGRWGE